MIENGRIMSTSWECTNYILNSSICITNSLHIYPSNPPGDIILICVQSIAPIHLGNFDILKQFCRTVSISSEVDGKLINVGHNNVK